MAQSKEDYIKDKGDKGDDVSFTLVNEDAVKRLKEDGVIKVPEKKISVPKDMRWNEKQMASKILQGIQNGDSVNKISKSLESVVDNNKVSAMRNARTMTTAAENRGRFDSYRKLDEQGVVQKKVWIATPDDRVRASHLDIDGEEQEINAPFSNGCQFPADGNGPAEEVWNCRCSMKDYIVGFRRKDGTISYVEGGPDKTMHSEQIAAKKAERQTKSATVTKFTLHDVMKRPERPLKADFLDKDSEVDWDKLQKAREEYRVEKEKWQSEIDRFVSESMPENMTLSEFEKWCESKDIKIYGDISKVDGKALRAYSERMEKLSADFPEVMKYREKLPIPKEFQKYEFAFENTTDYVAEATHGFTFGERGADINYLLSAQIDDVTQGYRVLGDGTLNQLFDHEFGHNVEAWIETKFERGEDGMLTKKGLEQYGEMKKDLLDNVYGKNGMSEYATTNENELFAEAFSSWYGGEKTEFANEFGKFLERWR